MPGWGGNYNNSTLEYMAWMDQAACKNADTNLFFPSHSDNGRPSGRGVYQQAKIICAGCEVKTQCLNFALKAFPHPEDDHGMWGGTSPRDRREIRRHQRMRRITV